MNRIKGWGFLLICERCRWRFLQETLFHLALLVVLTIRDKENRPGNIRARKSPILERYPNEGGIKDTGCAFTISRPVERMSLLISLGEKNLIWGALYPPRSGWPNSIFIRRRM